MIKNIGLAWISVTDLQQSKKFFTNVLGLQVSSDSAEHGWMELKAEGDSFLLGVAQVQDDKKEGCESVLPGQNAIVTMTVDDIVTAKAMLEQKEVKVLGDILEVPGHVKMLLFADQDGNKFQLVQMLDGK